MSESDPCWTYFNRLADTALMDVNEHCHGLVWSKFQAIFSSISVLDMHLNAYLLSFMSPQGRDVGVLSKNKHLYQLFLPDILE